MQCNQDQLDHWVMSKHAPVHLVEDTIHQFVWRNQCGKLLLSPSPGVSVNWEARKLGAEMKRGKLCGEHIWRPRGFLLYRIFSKGRSPLDWWASYVRLSTNHASEKLKEQMPSLPDSASSFRQRPTYVMFPLKNHIFRVKENIIISITTTMVSSVTSQFCPFKFFQ